MPNECLNYNKLLIRFGTTVANHLEDIQTIKLLDH